jgi:preprotein translocase subunit SecG
MFQFLLVCHVIVALGLVTVILMQRSEGGGLTGGSPSGLMSARGAADFLTRTTTILATLFVLLSIALAAVATLNRAPSEIDASLARKPGQDAALPAPAPADTNTVAPVTGSPVPLAVPTGAPAPKAAQTAPARPAPARATERRAAPEKAAAPASTPAKTDATPPVVVPTVPATTPDPQ